MQIASRLRELHGYRISLKDFFANPTISAIADRIRQAGDVAQEVSEMTRISSRPSRDLSELLEQLSVSSDPASASTHGQRAIK
jgi:hypothetical protein